MKVDAGQKEAKVLDATIHNAQRAQQLLAEHISSLAGCDFFGRSSVNLTWEAGQIVEIGLKIDRRMR